MLYSGFMRAIFFALASSLLLSAQPSFAETKLARGSLLIPTIAQSKDLRGFPKWHDMVARYDEQKKIIPPPCDEQHPLSCAVDDWKKLLASLHGKELAFQLERINDFANAHPYTLDRVNWNEEDYWATPFEFLKFSGDCEDYTIFKYYSLRKLGIPANRLRIIVVQDTNLGGIVHAILGVIDGRKTYILDNQIKQVVQAGAIYHYLPIFSMNETTWWLYPPVK